MCATRHVASYTLHTMPVATSAEIETMALRTRLVSKLTGLSASQLQYWHTTQLQAAHRDAGARGTPRLYSWLDYQRLCAVALLGEQGLPTARIRTATELLDRLFPEWWTRSLWKYDGRVPRPASSHATHVAHRDASGAAVLVDAGGQTVLPSSDFELFEQVERVVTGLEKRGALFKLNRFDDAVRMQPGINVGLPTLLGTRLETAFIASIVNDYGSVDEAARIYRLPLFAVRRAVEFEREVAAA